MTRTKMSRNNVIVTIALFFMFITLLNAQSLKVTGKVTDQKDNMPLPGANILVVGTNKGAQADFDGEFVIDKVDSNASLIISYVGYRNKIIQVNGQSSINVSLELDLQSLDEIVVIGYGSSRKSELTEAVSSVKSEEIEKSVGTSLEAALQGRISGVNIKTNESGPGSGLSITIRGATSINGTNEPLYVIDGVPIVKDNIGESSGGPYSSLPSDPLAGIDPTDVESIEVLKDASATAIYGSRGANGVVLITTKQGKSGKLSVTYDGAFGTDIISNKLDLLNGGEYYRYKYRVDPNDNLFTNVGGAFFINPNDIDESFEGIDWQDVVYREAYMQRHKFGFRGGNENTKIYASLGYFTQEGIIQDSDFDRYNALINMDSETDKFRVSASMNFAQTIREGSVFSSGGPNNDFAGTVSKIFYSRPIGNINFFDTSFDESLGDDEELDFFSNPYLFATEVTNDSKQTTITGNVNAFYEINDKLEIQARIGGNVSNNSSTIYFPRETTAGGRRLNGYARSSRVDAASFAFENLLHYNNKWKAHNLKVIAGYTLEKLSRDVLNVQNQGFAYDNTGAFDIGVGTDLIPPSSVLIESSLNSYLTRVNYNYGSKYFLTFTARIDGSSKFPAANKYAFFPSASAAWNIHNEKLIRKVDWINNFRVRYSYGQVGNQGIPAFNALGLLNDVTYSFGGGIQTGLVLSQLENKDLRWETTEQNNIGLDLGLFNNRISISAEAFIKKTNDVLLAVPVSSVVGVSTPFQNAGQIENKGLEFTLSTKNINSKNFTWDTNFNISVYKNTINSLGEISSFFSSFGPGQFSDLVAYREGGQIGEFWGFKTDGIITSEEELNSIPIYTNAEVGGWKIKDIDGNGEITTADKTVIGVNQPDFFGGLTNTFKMNNFDFSFFFEFSVGQEVYNANNVNLLNTNDSRNKLSSILDDSFALPTLDVNDNVIDPGNPNGTLPALGTAEFVNPIDAFVEDASYLRLQNVTIGYTLPVAEKLGISKLRTYLSANNLFLFTKYTGYDPDVNTTRNNGLIRGVDYGSYPKTRNFIFGINLVF